MMKKMFLILIIFGLLYSIIIALYGGYFVGFVLALITVGFATTIYLIDKKFDYRIIFYIWIAIIAIASLTLFLEQILSMGKFLTI
jgi:asparagine N-glycosylation enzyme membrane subunit Stt3